MFTKADVKTLINVISLASLILSITNFIAFDIPNTIGTLNARVSIGMGFGVVEKTIIKGIYLQIKMRSL